MRSDITIILEMIARGARPAGKNMADKSSLVKRLDASAVGGAASHFGQVAEHFMMKARSPRTRNIAYRIIALMRARPRPIRRRLSHRESPRRRPLAQDYAGAHGEFLRSVGPRQFRAAGGLVHSIVRDQLRRVGGPSKAAHQRG